MMKTFSFLLAVLLAIGCASKEQPAIVEINDNPELRELYEGDQAGRQVETIDWTVLNVADSLRRIRVMEIKEERWDKYGQ